MQNVDNSETRLAVSFIVVHTLVISMYISVGMKCDML